MTSIRFKNNRNGIPVPSKQWTYSKMTGRPPACLSHALMDRSPARLATGQVDLTHHPTRRYLAHLPDGQSVTHALYGRLAWESTKHAAMATLMEWGRVRPVVCTTPTSLSLITDNATCLFAYTLCCIARTCKFQSRMHKSMGLGVGMGMCFVGMGWKW